MRCYNGCPDSDLQSLLIHEANLEKLLKIRIPDARCTYFPNGDFYIVFVGTKGLWNTESRTLSEAIRKAFEIIEDFPS